VNVRVLAATNRNLAAEVRAGRFREDLFYRLNVVQVRVPPLRDRVSDIPLLARHFTTESPRADEPFDELMTRAAMELLLAYSWPGNVRQLRNEILRATLFSRGRGPLRPENFSDDVRGRASGEADLGTTLRDRVDVAQRSIVLSALHQHRWNKTRAARALGVTRQGLIKMIHRLGLPMEAPEPS
jgi:serine/threonine-protein kinase PknK